MCLKFNPQTNKPPFLVACRLYTVSSPKIGDKSITAFRSELIQMNKVKIYRSKSISLSRSCRGFAALGGCRVALV